jgi:two-component system sensor histidine kinase UhpB
MRPDHITTAEILATAEIERQRQRESLEPPILWISPIRVLLLMVLSIFVAEILVMLLLYELPQLPTPLEPVFDAGILLVLLSPTFYFFHFRPLKLHYLARKSVIEQLLKSEERLNLALTAVDDGLWDWDIESRQLFLSPRCRDILGFSHVEFKPLPQTWTELVHPEDHDQALGSLRKHLSGETESWASEHRLRAQSGDWVWVLVRGRVVDRDPTGQPRRAVGTMTDISIRKQAEEQLRQSKEEIRQLSRKLMRTSEVEKRSIARDLHDDFNQVLTAFQFGVEMLKEHSYKDEQDYQFQCNRLLELAARLQAETRQICDKLRPVMLDTIGLVATLQWLVDQVSQQAPGIEIRLSASPVEQHPTTECELVLYRICQEALTNSLKHAEANRVDINLVQTGQELTLVIRDNGRGFLLNAQRNRRRQSDKHWGFGLLGMHERAAAINGRVEIDSILGLGTTIAAHIPVDFKEGA